MIQANRTAFVDKLHERLAVQSGTIRVYEAILAKSHEEGLRQRLVVLVQRGNQHRELIQRFLTQLDAAPPAASSVRLPELEAEAFVRLIDEAQGEAQLLHLLLSRELADECGWELLINLARDASEVELVHTFSSVLKEKKEHLRSIRGAVATLARKEVTAVP